MNDERYKDVVLSNEGDAHSITPDEYIRLLQSATLSDDDDDDVKSNEQIARESEAELDLFAIKFDPTIHRKIELVQCLETGEILWSETDVGDCGCDETTWCKLCSNLELVVDMINKYQEEDFDLENEDRDLDLDEE